MALPKIDLNFGGAKVPTQSLSARTHSEYTRSPRVQQALRDGAHARVAGILDAALDTAHALSGRMTHEPHAPRKSAVPQSRAPTPPKPKIISSLRAHPVVPPILIWPAMLVDDWELPKPRLAKEAGSGAATKPRLEALLEARLAEPLSARQALGATPGAAPEPPKVTATTARGVLRKATHGTGEELVRRQRRSRVAAVTPPLGPQTRSSLTTVDRERNPASLQYSQLASAILYGASPGALSPEEVPAATRVEEHVTRRSYLPVTRRSHLPEELSNEALTIGVSDEAMFDAANVFDGRQKRHASLAQRHWERLNRRPESRAANLRFESALEHVRYNRFVIHKVLPETESESETFPRWDIRS